MAFSYILWGTIMATSVVVSTKPCPNCGAQMPVYRDYVTWCEQCDYGIEGDKKEAKRKNRIEKLYEELGKQQSHAIYENLRQVKSLEPAWSKTKIIIFSMATLIHLISLLLFITGLALLIMKWNYIVMDFFAPLFIGLAWILRPEPSHEPKENILSRKDYPAFYELVDQIGTSLGTHVDQIAINEWINASFTQTGWKQKHTVTLGLPLWEILTDQERVALLAHEVAHAVNGDASRGFFVGSAIQSLVRWYMVLAPGSDDFGSSAMNLLGVPFRLLAGAAAGAIWALIRLMSILLYRDMQRAEYLADRLGSTIGGEDAFISMLHKMVFGDTFGLAVQHCALNRQKTDLYQELQELIECTPPSELNRMRRLEDRSMLTLDVTHPPTGLRVKMLEEQGEQVPSFAADPEKMQAVAQQFAKLRKKIQAQLIERYLAAIS